MFLTLNDKEVPPAREVIMIFFPSDHFRIALIAKVSLIRLIFLKTLPAVFSVYKRRKDEGSS